MLLKKPRKLSRAEYKHFWLDNLRVEFVPIDLSSFDSVIGCAVELRKRCALLLSIAVTWDSTR